MFLGWQTYVKVSEVGRHIRMMLWLNIVLTLCWDMERLTFNEGLLKLGKYKSVYVTLQAE